jgi:hypothetical protein
LYNDDNPINNFEYIKSQRVIINQKISEEYTFNGAIRLSLNKLYPQALNFDEINIEIYQKIF